MRELFEQLKKEEEALPYYGSAGGVFLDDLSPELRAEIDKKVIPEIVGQGFKAVRQFLSEF